MDKWLEYWQQDNLQPDVFTDDTGNKHASLMQFWQKHITGFGEGASVLDIASGAGAVYRCVSNIADYDAHALDISQDALERLNADMPSVKTHSVFLNDNTLQDTQFDGVVSQFGIEYLGDKGFCQVPRLLKTGAKCVFLSHIRGGVVDNVTEQNLNGLLLVQRTDFLNRAQSVANAFRIDDKLKVEHAVKLFMKIEPVLADYCHKVPKGHHAHLYSGIKALLSRYNSYEHKTVIDWINVARKQAAENIERLQSMHNAALGTSDIDRISKKLSKQGLSILSTEPFYLRPGDPPAAWEIIGVKQR
ncbi:class I SAM-dependent methyltransferase [Glaciecola sp. SC05]|uniref:class I SAM-dependent methyltransferase n=1 Tax=Glaciecola sp. SC05 TaxID=1987355 RepID=UPI0035293207